jgi:hypothetical protein
VKTIKGPAILLAQFAGDNEPFINLTLDTNGMSGVPYQRPPYPDRMRSLLNPLAGGIQWSIGAANASLEIS